MKECEGIEQPAIGARVCVYVCARIYTIILE